MRARAHPLALLAVLALLAGAARPSPARADGDPGSDVLVYQSLYLSSAAGVSVPAQLRLGETLQRAQRAGVPIRVAIIARPSDLGAIGSLWRQPQAYARFLGLELALSYKGRLLVVMPNGVGFNWPGHSPAAVTKALRGLVPGTSGDDLAAGAQTAARRVAAASGVSLPPASASSSPTSTAPGGTPTSGPSARSQHKDTVVAAVVVALALLVAVGFGARRVVRARVARAPASGSRARLRWASGAALLALAAIGTVVVVGASGHPEASQSAYLAGNPNLDPGTPIARPAPDFALTDQFGRTVSLRSFRGKVVVLAFNDSECTTICPLTTAAMLQAKAMLGSAGNQVALLGVDANPSATSVQDVLSYSQLHGMLHAWHFLTGSLTQLRQVWKAYSIGVQISRKQVDHTPALFVIDRSGQLVRLYVTQQSYAAVGQFGQVLAQEIAKLLPGHPAVDSQLSYAHIEGISPTATATLPSTTGSSVTLGPGHGSHLLLFFASWAREVTSLGPQMDALNAYQATAAKRGLPPLTAVNETSVEPSVATVTSFLRGLAEPLRYPVALDRSGRLADGYGVQGEPWFVLTSPSGRIVWFWQVGSSGWLNHAALTAQVRAALARAPSAPTGAAALAGSPAPLAGLHAQASRLLGGSEPALAARVKALRGFPIVINAWASWCTPCKAEFGLFASASARFGRKVAFLGANSDDSPGDASAFLAEHPVSYPSYETSTSNLNALAYVGYLPTTIFINRTGKVVWVHTGQYGTQGSLDGDITRYALGG